MKFLIYADPHWSAYSSIVRSRGDKYSTRLHNLINTINWLEQQAVQQYCDAVICLGDFFDKCDLNSEELTALQEIKWSQNPHYFLTGNHEMGRGDLQFSSAHLFKLCPNTYTIDTQCVIDTGNNTRIVFLPYILEVNRQPLAEYLKPFNDGQNLIVMSHNDISGIQMGQYLSKDGFSIEEIEQNCKLFINGHLHNGTNVGKNIINLGNITGQNFSEDAFVYSHKCLLLDTEEQTIDYLDNPYAFNFFKIDLTNTNEAQNILNSLGSNAVVTIKTSIDNNDEIKQLLNNYPNIIESRVIVDLNKVNTENNEDSLKDLSIDHIGKFIDYIKSNVGTSDKIMEELTQLSGRGE